MTKRKKILILVYSFGGFWSITTESMSGLSVTLGSCVEFMVGRMCGGSFSRHSRHRPGSTKWSSLEAQTITAKAFQSDPTSMFYNFPKQRCSLGETTTQNKTLWRKIQNQTVRTHFIFCSCRQTLKEIRSNKKKNHYLKGYKQANWQRPLLWLLLGL